VGVARLSDEVSGQCGGVDADPQRDLTLGRAQRVPHVVLAIGVAVARILIGLGFARRGKADVIEAQAALRAVELAGADGRDNVRIGEALERLQLETDEAAVGELASTGQVQAMSLTAQVSPHKPSG
jgi:hypothetical protein